MVSLVVLTRTGCTFIFNSLMKQQAMIAVMFWDVRCTVTGKPSESICQQRAAKPHFFPAFSPVQLAPPSEFNVHKMQGLYCLRKSDMSPSYCVSSSRYVVVCFVQFRLVFQLYEPAEDCLTYKLEPARYGINRMSTRVHTCQLSPPHIVNTSFRNNLLS